MSDCKDSSLFLPFSLFIPPLSHHEKDVQRCGKLSWEITIVRVRVCPSVCVCVDYKCLVLISRTPESSV